MSWLRDKYNDLKDFLDEFWKYCAASLLIILAGFGPLALAGGTIKHPVWLLLYIPVLAGVMQYNEENN